MEELSSLLERARALEGELWELRRRIAGLPHHVLEGRMDVLCCEVGPLHAAIPLRDVDEVVPVAALADVPEAPEWIRGALNIGGQLVPVVDLARRLGTTCAEPTLDDSIVLCTAGGRRAGLLVTSIPRLLQLDARELASPSSGLAHAPYVLGLAQIEGASVVVLSVLLLAMSSALPLEDA